MTPREIIAAASAGPVMADRVLKALATAGYVIVPRVPTEAMKDVAWPLAFDEVVWQRAVQAAEKEQGS